MWKLYIVKVYTAHIRLTQSGISALKFQGSPFPGDVQTLDENEISSALQSLEPSPTLYKANQQLSLGSSSSLPTTQIVSAKIDYTQVNSET